MQPAPSAYASAKFQLSVSPCRPTSRQPSGLLPSQFQRRLPLSELRHRPEEPSKCFPANSPGPSLPAPRPSRSRAVLTGSSAPPPAPAQPAASSGFADGHGSGGGGSNARSGPASGGASGAVGSVSASSFTMTTSAGQKVTVSEASSTTYQKGRPRPRRVPSQQASASSSSGRPTERRLRLIARGRIRPRVADDIRSARTCPCRPERWLDWRDCRNPRRSGISPIGGADLIKDSRGGVARSRPASVWAGPLCLATASSGTTAGTSKGAPSRPARPRGQSIRTRAALRTSSHTGDGPVSWTKR